MSQTTIVGLLLIAAPAAGIIEESAFRGYMQSPIERHIGVFPAILITGTVFALAHLDFTPILWPYYVAVAAIYGTITHVFGSIMLANNGRCSSMESNNSQSTGCRLYAHVDSQDQSTNLMQQNSATAPKPTVLPRRARAAMLRRSPVGKDGGTAPVQRCKR